MMGSRGNGVNKARILPSSTAEISLYSNETGKENLLKDQIWIQPHETLQIGIQKSLVKTPQKQHTQT